MTIFTIVVLTTLVFMLSVMLGNTTSKCTEKDVKLLEKSRQIHSMQMIILELRNYIENKDNKTASSNINVNAQIKEAIHYAVKASHPDNGGRPEDFIKFKKLYDSMK